MRVDAVRLRHAHNTASLRSDIDAAPLYVHPICEHDEWVFDFRPRQAGELLELSEWLVASPWVKVKLFARYEIRRQDFRTDRDLHGITMVASMKDAVLLKMAHDFLVAPQS